MNTHAFYRFKHIMKQVFPILIVLTASLLLAGFPSLLILITTNNALLINGTIKEVMCSGITLFLIILGVMGFYFWTRTDFKHYGKLCIVGTIFFFIASIGLQWLFNYAYS